MKRKALALLCALAMLTACLPGAYAASPAGDETPVLVGLNYGKTALAGANLLNDVGSGYYFGILDEDRAFHSLAYTAETSISVIKTQNVSYGTVNGYESYSDAITSEVTVGQWHVLLPVETPPGGFEEALALAQSAGGFPAWIDGAWQIRYGSYTTQEEAQAAAAALGGTATGTSAYGISVVKRGTAAILFQFDVGEGGSLAVQPGLDPAVKPVTYFKNNRYYGIFHYQRVNGGDLTVSNLVPMSDYISCVISREMSGSWPLEALKAQAVCARSYYHINLGRHKANGFDICATTDCQVYFGMGAANERTAQATAETEGLGAWYHGEPAHTFYFSSDGGATEDVRNVWSSSADMPYLCGVTDPYEATVSDKIAYWDHTKTFTSQELTSILQKKGYNCAAIVDFQVTELTATGNVKSITLTDANGKPWPFYKLSGVRDMLGLKSMRYTVTRSGASQGGDYCINGSGTTAPVAGAYAISGDGSVEKLSGNPYVITASGASFLPASGSGGETTFTVRSSGSGHHVGMSQWGAYAMAQQGKTFREILTFYFPGIEIY